MNTGYDPSCLYCVYHFPHVFHDYSKSFGQLTVNELRRRQLKRMVRNLLVLFQVVTFSLALLIALFFCFLITGGI
jgi:hypothetical protein